MTITASYRVQCDDCGALLYDDRTGDEHPTEEAAKQAASDAGWNDGYGRTACPEHKTPTPAP
jgi:hypothetical protein